MNKEFFKNNWSYILILILILFNEILPQNPFIPKLNQVIISIKELYSNYNLTENFLVSIVTFFVCFVLSFVLLVFISDKLITKTEIGKSANNLFLFIPEVLIAFLINHWLHDSIFSAFVFLMIISVLNGIIKLNHEMISFSTKYIEPALTLGLDQKRIKKIICRKGTRSIVFRILLNEQKWLWTMLIIFEFIRGSEFGIGYLFKLSLEYWHSHFLFASIGLCFFIIYLNEKITLAFQNKFFFWEKN